jgi:hypothetical protein
MKKNIMKALLITGLVTLGGLTATYFSVNAASANDTITTQQASFGLVSADGLTVEEMLQYAIGDEYLALAEYQAIITTYGSVKPFSNIVNAEQTHINLLLPLFETYGFVVSENTAADSVIIPESITASIATGIEAETANIAMYNLFLGREDLPEDVKAVFTLLRDASTKHLAAFSKDRYCGVGTDLMNQVKNQFQKGGKQNKAGSGNQQKGSVGNAGVCPNI